MCLCVPVKYRCLIKVENSAPIPDSPQCLWGNAGIWLSLIHAPNAAQRHNHRNLHLELMKELVLGWLLQWLINRRNLSRCSLHREQLETCYLHFRQSEAASSCEICIAVAEFNFTPTSPTPTPTTHPFHHYQYLIESQMMQLVVRLMGTRIQLHKRLIFFLQGSMQPITLNQWQLWELYICNANEQLKKI